MSGPELARKAACYSARCTRECQEVCGPCWDIGGCTWHDRYRTETEYRVEYIVQRQQPGDDDFADVGFGSSGAWGTPEQAGYMAKCAIQRREWETTPGMPEPEDA